MFLEYNMLLNFFHAFRRYEIAEEVRFPAERIRIKAQKYDPTSKI